MKRLLMAIAIATAATFAAGGIQSAIANDAHHPAAQTTKAKKVKAAKKAKKTSGMSMQCPMMKGQMMKGHMTKRHMMQHGKTMKCPMMGASKSHRMGMMHKH